LAKMFSRWPFQRAGFSPCLYLCTRAQSSTACRVYIFSSSGLRASVAFWRASLRGYERERSQSNIARLAAQGVAEQPRLRDGGAELQVKVAPVNTFLISFDVSRRSPIVLIVHAVCVIIHAVCVDSGPVARIGRSEIRDRPLHAALLPRGFAALDPG